MPSAFSAARAAAARAAAAVRAEYEGFLRRAEQPGPDVKVQPFAPGSVTPGAAIFKLGSSVFAAARAHANAERKLKADEDARQLRELNREHLMLSIAKQQADLQPQETYPLTTSPTGEIVTPSQQASLVGPPEPGTVTRQVPGKEYTAALFASRRIGQGEQRLGLSQEAGARADVGLGLREQANARAAEAHAQRIAKSKISGPEANFSPIDQGTISEARKRANEAYQNFLYMPGDAQAEQQYNAERARQASVEAPVYLANFKRAIASKNLEMAAGIARRARDNDVLSGNPDFLRAIGSAIPPGDEELGNNPDVLTLLQPLRQAK